MLKNYTIRNKIIISFITILVLALSISGIFSLSLYYNTLKDSNYNSLNLTINNVQNVMESNFTSLNSMTSTFLTNHYIADWIKNKYSFSSDSVKNNSDLVKIENEIAHNLMFNDFYTQKYVNTAYMFADNNCIRLVNTLQTDNFKIQAIHYNIYNETKNLNLGSYYILHNNVCYFVKVVSNINYTKKLVLIVMLNQDNFSKVLKDLPHYYSAFIENENGTVMFSNNSSFIGKDSLLENNSNNIINKNTSLIVTRNLNNPKFKIIVSIPKDVLTKDLTVSSIIYILIVAIFIIFTSIIAYNFAIKYTSFIPVLVNNLNEIRKGNYNARIPNYEDHDLNKISITFNHMTQEFQDMINKEYKNEILLKNAELKLLQSQMNPHFLINTLTTISTKALLSNNSEIYEMVNSLTNLLGVSLSNNKNTFIKIADELQYIKEYLFIQHIRFQDKLSYSISIENDELLEFYIPRLSIEPIVENAVIHGLEDTITGGKIIITIYYDSNENILFKIQDNGKGFNINELLNTSNPKSHNIGIKNTNRRLKLIYGNQYGIRFESQKNCGTTAYITIPKKNLSDCEGDNIHV